MIRAFINRNKAWSAALERKLPQARTDHLLMYDRAVAACVQRLHAPVIVDVGGGKQCSFAAVVDRTAGARIIAVDISEDELRQNADVDDKRVADIAKGLPFADADVDLFTSRTVLEHIDDVDTFVAHSARVLRPGGYAVHLIPGRFAPFAVLARALPFGLAKAILQFLRPQTVGVIEFPVFYDKCTYSALSAAHARHGYSLVSASAYYYQSDYFDAFFPAYCASALYELVIRALGFRNLAAYVLVVARR